MFELIEALDGEARQALFGTVMDVFRSGRGQVETRDILASFLRAPSLATTVQELKVDLDAIVAQLAAPKVGSGTFEKLRRAIDAQASGDASSEDAFSDIGLPERGGFLNLPLSANGRETFGQLVAAFATAPEESVTPREVLVEILRSDQQLKELCDQFGLRLDKLT